MQLHASPSPSLSSIKNSRESGIRSHLPPSSPIHPRYFLKRTKFSSLPGLGLPASVSYSQRRRNYIKQRIQTDCLRKAPNEVLTPPGLPQSYLANFTLQLVLVQLHTVLGVVKREHQVKLDSEAAMFLPQEPIEGPVLALTPRPQVSSTFQVGMRKLDGANTTKRDKKPWMMFENMNSEPWLYFAS